MIFGYCRISTQKEKQKTDRQIQTLKKYAEENNFTFDEIIEERISGSINTENRPKYKILRNKIRKEDILVVTDIDRLGRNADDTIIELKELKSSGVRVIILDIPYMNDFNKMNNDSIGDMITDIMITLKSHIAQQEREKTITRINQGLDAARQKGKKLGRPCLDIKSFKKEYEKYMDGKYGNISVCQWSQKKMTPVQYRNHLLCA